METVQTPKCIPIKRPFGGGKLMVARRRPVMASDKMEYAIAFYPINPDRFKDHERIVGRSTDLGTALADALMRDGSGDPIVRAIAEYLSLLPPLPIIDR